MTIHFQKIAGNVVNYFRRGGVPDDGDTGANSSVASSLTEDPVERLQASKDLYASAVSLTGTALDSIPAQMPPALIAELTGMKIPSDALTLLQDVVALKSAIDGYLSDSDRNLEQNILEIHQKAAALREEFHQIQNLIVEAEGNGDTALKQQLQMTQTSLVTKHHAVVTHARQVEMELNDRVIALRADLAHRSVSVGKNGLALATDVLSLAHKSICLKMGLASSAVMTGLACAEGVKAQHQLSAAKVELARANSLMEGEITPPVKRLGTVLADNAMRAVEHLKPQRNARLRKIAGWAAVTAGAGVLAAGGGVVASAALLTAGTATLAHGAVNRLIHRTPQPEMSATAPEVLSQAIGENTLASLSTDRTALVALGQKLGQDGDRFANSVEVLGLSSVLDTLFQSDLGYQSLGGDPIDSPPKWAVLAEETLVDIQDSAIEVVSGLSNRGANKYCEQLAKIQSCNDPQVQRKQVGHLLTGTLSLMRDWHADAHKALPNRNELANLKLAINRMMPVVGGHDNQQWRETLRFAKREVMRILEQDLDKEKASLLTDNRAKADGDEPVDLTAKPYATSQEKRDLPNLSLTIEGVPFAWKDANYSDKAEKHSVYLDRFAQHIKAMLPAQNTETTNNLLINRLLAATTQTIEAPYMVEFRNRLPLAEDLVLSKIEQPPSHSITREDDTVVKTGTTAYQVVSSHDENRAALRQYDTVIEQRFNAYTAELIDEKVTYRLAKMAD
jgi:hypothetical protein